MLHVRARSFPTRRSADRPPLRGLRADAALAQATASLRAAEADEVNARRSLAALFGVDTPPAELSGSDLLAPPRNVDAMAMLDVRLAEAERVIADAQLRQARAEGRRSEEHTSELQSLMRKSYAVFCMKKKKLAFRNPTTDLNT